METVKVALTARQKNQIRRATGKTISSLKIEPAGKVTLAKGRKILVGSARAGSRILVTKARTVLGGVKGRVL